MSDTDAETEPASDAHRTTRFRRREVSHVAGYGAVVVFALGYMVADFEFDRLYPIVRSVAAVAAVALLLWLHESRVRQQLSQMRSDQAAFQARIEALLDAELERQRGWKAYADVLSDLGGLPGEDSGDISIRRRY
jgi:2-methylcitrate dehydratase PrpD